VKKVTVVGVGNLGSCIAYEVANRGLVDKLVLVDICQELAEGNATDIAQALAFRNNTEVKAGDYKDAEGSQVIVVTAGKPRSPDMKSRMELFEANRRIIAAVASEIRKNIGQESVIVTLTNPVDVMNYLMWKNVGLDRRKVLGSAGMLDSARLRTVLARMLRTPVLDVKAYVLGEHGESQVPVFSQVSIEGRKRAFNQTERREMAKRLRESALEVISKKGATIYAPTSNTVTMIQAILHDEKRLAVCSVVLDGEYGLKNVSLGVPVILGENGVEQVLEWELDEEEKAIFYQGAENLRKTIADVSAM